MNEEAQSAGDPLPVSCELIEVRVAELKQLFNAMDASPFRERDLDPDAEDFIVGWAREAPSKKALALLVRLDRGPGPADEPTVLRDVIHEFFAHRAKATRRSLHQLLVIGRISLLVGVVFLGLAIGASGLIATAMKGQRLGELLRQGLVICGWVAMWRPLEIFLYGWWPIRTEARLYDRLGKMPLRVAYAESADPDAWRNDWPNTPPLRTTQQKSPPRSSSRGASGPTPAVPERGPIAPTAIASVATKPGGAKI